MSLGDITLGSLKVIANSLQILQDQYAFISDGNADGYQYEGTALPGTLTSTAAWQIKRFNLTGNPLVVQWADGDNFMNNIWDNRTSLTYS